MSDQPLHHHEQQDLEGHETKTGGSIHHPELISTADTTEGRSPATAEHTSR